MILLKIVFNSLVTAAFAAVAAGLLSFLCVLVAKSNEGKVGEGMVQAVGAGIGAGVAGLVLGVVGSLLFPGSYLKYLAMCVLVVVGLVTLGWRVIHQFG